MKISRTIWRSYAALLTVAVMVIAFYVGIHQSIWFDEAYSILLSKEPVSSLVSLAGVDAHPPLYYLYLKAWAAAFGYSEASLRLSSVMPFGVSVVGILFVLREFFSRKVALYASLILLFAPFLLRYGFEVRMYAVSIAIGVWATFVLLRARHTNRKELWLPYGLLVALGLYTLYMSAVFWVWHAVWVVIEDRKKIVKRPLSGQWMAYGLAAVLFVPWLPTLYSQLKHNVLPPEVTAVTLDQITNVTTMYFAYLPRYAAGAWISLLIMTAAILTIYVIVKLWRQLTPLIKSGYRLVCLGWIASLGFFMALSLPPQPPRFMERYMVLAAMMFYLTLGLTAALAVRHARLKKLGLALSCLLALIGFVGVTTLAQKGNYNFQRMQRPYGQQVMAAINGCNDTSVVVKSPYEYIDLSYYLSGCDVRFYQEYNPDYRGGYAMLHNTTRGITSLSQLSAKRIIVIDVDERMTVGAYKAAKQYPIENVIVQEYTR